MQQQKEKIKIYSLNLQKKKNQLNNNAHYSLNPFILVKTKFINLPNYSLHA